MGQPRRLLLRGLLLLRRGLRYGRRSLPPRAEPGPARADSRGRRRRLSRLLRAPTFLEFARTPKLLRLNLRERGTTPRARATPRRRHGTTPESGVRLRASVELALTRGRAFLLLRLNLSQRFTPSRAAVVRGGAAPRRFGRRRRGNLLKRTLLLLLLLGGVLVPRGGGAEIQPLSSRGGRSTPAPPQGAAGASNDPG